MVQLIVAVCSVTGSAMSKSSEDVELTSSQRAASGQDDATSTTALAGSFVSNAAATGVLGNSSEMAPVADADVQL